MVTILGWLGWSALCFGAGALWTKEKAQRIDPDLRLSIYEMMEEDAGKAKDYLLEKIDEYQKNNPQYFKK